MLVARRIAVLMPMMVGLTCLPFHAQTVAPLATLAQQQAEPLVAPFAFDVATFKLSAADVNHFSGGGFSESGYHATNFTLSGIVFSAYFPLISHDHQFIDMPEWANKEYYDVVAHIDQAVASDWLRLTPLQRQAPGRLMLQKLLADRCKLVAHTVPAQVDGFVLVVGKGGSRLSPSKPGAIYPSDAKNGPDGSRILSSSPSGFSTMNFFNTTVGQLADMLGWGWDIHDQTNLTGRYDFTIRRLELRDADGKRIADPQPDDLWDISATGLEIKRAKVPSENLVIEHIERPSEN